MSSSKTFKLLFQSCLAVVLLAVGSPIVSADSDGIAVEHNVDIPLRDGVNLKANIFLPEGRKSDSRFPVVLSITAYQKDMVWVPAEGHGAKPGPYQNWETPNPEQWVPEGYVIVRVDTRGTGQSPGIWDPATSEEARDIVDVIEWISDQSWSNGNVGMTGISYMAIHQWQVASFGPPALKAIIPWEGFSDQYRNGLFNGGLMSYSFLVGWYNGIMYDAMLRNYPVADGAAYGNSWLFKIMSHPIDGPFWEDRRADLDKVTVPLFSAANWNGWQAAGHLKGNLDGYKNVASKSKKLEVHTGHYTDDFYTERGFQAQLRFFDRWLKDEENGVMEEAPIKLAIRRSVADRHDYFWRTENEWPIARTKYQRFYLGSADGGTLLTSETKNGSELSYPAPNGSVEFVSKPFAEETEVTGEVLAKLWASSDINDMNVHASLMVIHPDGVEEILTKGRLRASMRRLDDEKSTYSQPYHRFDKKELLEPGEIVPLTVEIWPTSMIFQKGSRVKLKILATESTTRTGNRQEPRAVNTIHVGGEYVSYLQLPIVPEKQ
jgi:predicted acyl esterase